MIGLISRPDISCNYWDGISTVSMINGHLTLFVLACHWLLLLPVTKGFYFLYSASRTHRNILNTSSITPAENLSIITDHFQDKMLSLSRMLWQVNSLFFPGRLFSSVVVVFTFCQKLTLTNFASPVIHTHGLRPSDLFSFFLFSCPFRYKSLCELTVGIHEGRDACRCRCFCASMNTAPGPGWPSPVFLRKESIVFSDLPVSAARMGTLC